MVSQTSPFFLDSLKVPGISEYGKANKLG